MTTTVKVEACCDDKTEVIIEQTGNLNKVINNGESYECVIYDNISVRISEREKGSQN